MHLEHCLAHSLCCFEIGYFSILIHKFRTLSTTYTYTKTCYLSLEKSRINVIPTGTREIFTFISLWEHDLATIKKNTAQWIPSVNLSALSPLCPKGGRSKWDGENVLFNVPPFQENMIECTICGKYGEARLISSQPKAILSFDTFLFHANVQNFLHENSNREFQHIHWHTCSFIVPVLNFYTYI